MIFTTANNINTTLAAPVLAGDLTITLASSAGLPTIPTGSLMPVTMTDAASETLHEIGYVSGISGATLTLARGKEGTSALAWAVGDIVSVNPTAFTISNDIPTIQIITATKTLTLADSGFIVIDDTAGSIDLTLPLAADLAGVEFNFSRKGLLTNAVRLLAAAGDTLSGQANITISPYESIRSMSDGLVTQKILTPGAIKLIDPNGKQVVTTVAAAFPINDLAVTNSAAGNALLIGPSSSSEANVSVAATGKGVGKFNIDGNAETATTATTASAVLSGAIKQGSLSSTTQLVSVANSTAGPHSVTAVPSGGQYHTGSPYAYVNNTIDITDLWASYYQTISAVNNGGCRILYSVTSASGRTAYGTFRYITASPPYDLGDGEIPMFIFGIVNNSTGKLEATSISVDPPWANNGKTIITPTRIDAKSGRKFRDEKIITPEIRLLPLDDQKIAIDELTTTEIEITQAVKNADMVDIPHPFQAMNLNGKTVVMLDPISKEVDSFRTLFDAGENIVEIIHGKNIKLSTSDNINRAMPPGVPAIQTVWKNTRR